MMTFGSLFSGIGGIDLGLERAGMTCAWQVEIDPWCRQVLTKHWPNVRRYEDVSAVGGDTLEPVDVIAGGFPCQDVSVAGQRAGIQDGNRSGLWSEFHRIIRELRPRYVFVENVPGLLTNGMGRVLSDLADIGYDAEWEVLSAADVGAPHLRKRVFITAHNRISDASGDELRVVRERGGREHINSSSSISGNDGEEEQVADAQIVQCNGRNDNSRICQQGGTVSKFGNRSRTKDVADAISNATGATYRSSGRSSEQRWDDESVGQRDTVGSHTGDGSADVSDAQRERENWWTTEPDVGRVANGVPRRVDRLKGLGNAVVPQCAEWVGRKIVSSET